MNRIVIIILILFNHSCQSQEKESSKHEHRRWIGDIVKDREIDNHDFEICSSENRIIQYFNNSQGLEYQGEKREVIKIFKNEFIPLKKDNQNGIIRIRFIVNCKGDSGRFRIMEANTEYKKFHFDIKITDQLLKITKN